MSEPLSLDFVEQPVWTINRVSFRSLGLLAIAGVAMFLLFQNYQRLTTEYNTVVETSPTREVTQPMDEAIRPLSAAELKTVRQTVADLGTPWGQLLSGLEAVRMKHVALLLLEPNKKKSRVTLTGQAKSIQDMLQYVESVSALPMLSNVYLQNHMIEMNDPDKPVNFTILANWQ